MDVRVDEPMAFLGNGQPESFVQQQRANPSPAMVDFVEAVADGMPVFHPVPQFWKHGDHRAAFAGGDVGGHKGAGFGAVFGGGLLAAF